jgi:D-serine deaminase-like pyridoxal phosphate-dependent protein
MPNDLPTPCIVLDAQTVRRNVERLAKYTRDHKLNLRPHTKTHKSIQLGKLQMEHGAIGLTVAKSGEAHVMVNAAADILMAYPPVHPGRCAELANLARSKTIRVGIDSAFAADALSTAAKSAGSTIGILVDLDIGHHRTGVQTAAEALALAQHVSKTPGLRLDGVMFFPGQLSHGPPTSYASALAAIDAHLAEVIDLWKKSGLECRIVSGGSTPAASQSHLLTKLTEIRPGTYIFNDMNSVHSQCATLDDCAARILATVVSTAVPGQIVLDSGTKTLTSDRCGPAPDSGHGHIVEYPGAKITKLSEEHAQVDVTQCDRIPKVGDQVNIIPNHICPCVNLQDTVYWREPGEAPKAMNVDARGRVF